MSHFIKTFLATLLFTAATTLSANPISEIQGSSHQSPLNGKETTTQGVVTWSNDKGFYLQSLEPDNDPNTSEAIYVFNKGNNPSIGSQVTLSGTVKEYAQGKPDSYNLETTELTRIRIKGVGDLAALPAPVAIDSAQRPIPWTIKEPGSPFDADRNALDYWESLESMRVTIDTPYVIGASNKYGEFTVLAHPDEAGLLRTPRGGLILPDDGVSSQRIQVIFQKDDKTDLNVGDILAGPLTGIVTYSYGNYKIQLTEPFPGIAKKSQAPKLPTPSIPQGALKIATFNVENLHPGNPDEKFARLADIILNKLHSPDILGLQEIQDNNGPTNDGTVAADQTLAKLIEAITAAGGPTYSYVQRDPQNNADGGQPGSNIRNVFLFNSQTVTLKQVQRYEHPAFIANEEQGLAATRKPLIAIFNHGKDPVIVVNCHLKSKGGDAPDFGSLQPAVKYTEEQRSMQATAVGQLCARMIKQAPKAKVIVLGDMNDFEFSAPLQLMEETGGLVDLVHHVPAEQRYSYSYQGHNQALDHFLVNTDQADKANIRICHINSDYAAATRVSDHDPILVWFPSK